MTKTREVRLWGRDYVWVQATQTGQWRLVPKTDYRIRVTKR